MKFINNSDDLTRYLGIPVKKNIDIKSISTDTRSIKKGALFIAIKGDFFNGNDYVENAISKKACLVITDDKKFKKTKIRLARKLNFDNHRIDYKISTSFTFKFFKICR